ncbi:MAG TPA: PRC-barrel domain-containing protein [Acidimicrobiales bacterium]|nr:PRC-barrel domain-containing protein [Acidimicrobiales bacterium]
MAGIDISDIDELIALRGRAVVDSNGDTAGAIEQIWVDQVNGLPEWATVKMGRIRGHRRLVSLRPVEIRDDDIVVAYTKEQIEEAPEFDPETATPEDERKLYRHYGRPLTTPRPAEVRNPFARVQPVWAPTHWSGAGSAADSPG